MYDTGIRFLYSLLTFSKKFYSPRFLHAVLIPKLPGVSSSHRYLVLAIHVEWSGSS